MYDEQQKVQVRFFCGLGMDHADDAHNVHNFCEACPRTYFPFSSLCFTVYLCNVKTSTNLKRVPITCSRWIVSIVWTRGKSQINPECVLLVVFVFTCDIQLTSENLHTGCSKLCFAHFVEKRNYGRYAKSVFAPRLCSQVDSKGWLTHLRSGVTSEGWVDVYFSPWAWTTFENVMNDCFSLIARTFYLVNTANPSP